jgi:hypothetical protein
LRRASFLDERRIGRPIGQIRGGCCVFCFLNVSGARTLERVYLERDLDNDAQALATVRRLRLSERSEMVTRISRMTDIWPSLISALVTLWSWVSLGRLPASPCADEDRRTRSVCSWHPAVSGQSPYLSASLTAVGRRLRHASGSVLSARLGRAGESLGACVPAEDGRRGHDRVSIHALSHALFQKSLPKGPAWGLFVWDLEGVGAALRAFPPGLLLPGMAWRILSAWA